MLINYFAGVFPEKKNHSFKGMVERRRMYLGLGILFQFSDLTSNPQKIPVQEEAQAWLRSEN